MTSDWMPAETNTHQDHVIAHLIGATVLGYFIMDQATHVLLDIGFIWTIYIDGEMGLVPDSMAVSELEIDENAKAELIADIQRLHDEGRDAEKLTRITPAAVECLVTDVLLYTNGERHRILINGEEARSLAVEIEPAAGEMVVQMTPAGNNG